MSRVLGIGLAAVLAVGVLAAILISYSQSHRTATDYLPSALQAYLNLPRAYATLHRMPNGKTADQVLSDQLDLLSTKMDEVADAVHKKDSDALLANARFLEEKFGPSALSLPQSGSAA